jgi:hypothetical protein
MCADANSRTKSNAPAQKAGGRYKFKSNGRDARLKLAATKFNAWRGELVDHQAGDA